MSLVGYSPWGHSELDTTEATKLLSKVSQAMTNIMISLFCGIKKMTQMNLFSKHKHSQTQKTNLLDFPGDAAGKNPPAGVGARIPNPVQEDPHAGGQLSPA